jgi:hypothetical protein
MNFYGGEDQSIVDSVITNGDDCISVVPSGDPATALCVNHPEQCRGGSLLVHNVTCKGGHGLSIGKNLNSIEIRFRSRKNSFEIRILISKSESRNLEISKSSEILDLS